MYTISVLARKFGLSRASLLYYDRIGLLRPSGRSAKAYRHYSEADADRLAQICHLRQAGLPLNQIKALLEPRDAAGGNAHAALATHLNALGAEIQRLRLQQARVARLMFSNLQHDSAVRIDRPQLVERLLQAGLRKDELHSLHVLFEQTNPIEHARFLRALGLSDDEVARLRASLALAD